MSQSLIVLMAQMNPIVGDIEHNTSKILDIIQTHQDTHDVILFPELAICGYPAEDLLLRPAFHQRIEIALQHIVAATLNCHVILGHPHLDARRCYNAASVLYQQRIITQYHKQQLPNYGVFDEKRYFTPGAARPCILTIKAYRVGICICEDLWKGNTVDEIIQAGIDVLCILNASPFDDTKPAQRQALIQSYAQQGIVILYVNLVGGQDELVFDGQSLVFDGQGDLRVRAPAFEEAVTCVTIDGTSVSGNVSPEPESLALIYQALVIGLRDYVTKNQCPGVLLGLSGGVDSALTLAIAVDALGADRVTAVLMPSQYSADISRIDALAQACNLEVNTHTLPIDPSFKALLTTLDPVMNNQSLGITAENLQARIRGVLLMALSNQTGYMLLSTSNKSEIAVGYGTLYGDMCGGYAVLKDVLKTRVYALARYRNRHQAIIPERVLTRAPSAELAPNQTDQDSLPDYAILDAIIQGYVEQTLSYEQLLAAGYPEDAVALTLRLIKRNEYKRHQVPPGTKISPCAFGRDWRYPLTQQFNEKVSVASCKIHTSR